MVALLAVYHLPMALTVANANPELPNVRVAAARVTFDSSYPTGGEAISAADLGLNKIDFVVATAPGYVLNYLASTGKLLAYWVDTTVDGAAMAEVANTTDLSAVVANVLAFDLGDANFA